MKQIFKIIFLTGTLWVSLITVANAQQLDNISEQDPFSIHGNISVNVIGYNATGIEDRARPFALMLSANAIINSYGFEIPFSFRFSDKRVDYTQPFNQFGLSPSYKWLTTHFGYRNISFSDYTLAGHTFLGAGVEMHPGKFRFGAVYGRFRKTTVAYENAIDNTRNLNRKGFAIKLGVGSEKTFVDLIVMKVNDDSTTAIRKPGEVYNPAESNLVTGLNSRITFSKKVWFEGEVAGSLYTTDVSAYGFEGLEDDPWLSRLDKITPVNLSTELLTAIRSSLNYKSKSFSTKLEYRRIDPGYRSMGAYFFNNDLENLVIAPAFSLFKRKLNLRGSIGLQRDNLRNTRKATSLRTISAINLSYNPVPVFGIDINYNNYSSNQRAGRLPLIDSLKFFQATTNLGIMPRLMIMNEKHSHILMLMFNKMKLNDKNALTAQYTENDATIVNLNYNLGLNQSAMTLLLGFTYNKLQNSIFENSASGFTAGVSKSWLEGKLQSGLSNSLIWSGQKGDADKDMTLNTSVNSSYQINKRHSLRLNVFFIRFMAKGTAQEPTFNELKGDFGYVFTF
jgi:hypothetical protein